MEYLVSQLGFKETKWDLGLAEQRKNLSPPQPPLIKLLYSTEPRLLCVPPAVYVFWFFFFFEM